VLLGFRDAEHADGAKVFVPRPPTSPGGDAVAG